MMILTILMIVMMKGTMASLPDPEMDIKLAVETGLIRQVQRACDRVNFGATEIPLNISSDTRCL